MAWTEVVANLPELYADPLLDAECRTWAACTGSMLTRHRLDGTFCYASAASQAILGWEPEELVGKKLGAISATESSIGIDISERLAAEESLRESEARARGLIREKVGRLVRLVDDLLDVWRITNGIIQLLFP